MAKSWWLVAFLIVGVLLGAGVLLLVTRPPRGEAVVLLPPPTTAPILVHVSGGVRQPGLYELPPGSRVDDAIQAAGGYSSEADITSTNLAQFLQDGEQIDIPEKIPYLTPTPQPESQTRIISTAPGLVNINTATLEQLDTLPEIGPKTAQKIIDYRDAHGPFATIEEIQDVSGIGPVTFDKIKDLITIAASP
ncbi:MAG: helix-hairpin-helix domain-containing protein [Acidobacteriaceae bacterium]